MRKSGSWEDAAKSKGRDQKLTTEKKKVPNAVLIISKNEDGSFHSNAGRGGKSEKK